MLKTFPAAWRGVADMAVGLRAFGGTVPTLRLAASPLSRKVAREAGFDIAALAGRGSGPGGRIVFADVFAALESGEQPSSAAGAAASSAPSATSASGTVVAADGVGDGYMDVGHVPSRHAIAARLTQSKLEAPQFVLTANLTLDPLLELRARLNAALDDGAALSVNDFLVKAAALSQRSVPEMNSSWLPDAVRAYDYVDVCVSVATPDGVVTPVVRDADAKGLATISADVRRLADAARSGTLTADDYAGGTFTVTNMGAFGVRHFTGIVNPPQAGVLAIGVVEPRVVPSGAATGAVDDDGKPVLPYKVVTQTTVSVTCDHRVVDGAVGAEWLAAFRQLVENPERMLL